MAAQKQGVVTWVVTAHVHRSETFSLLLVAECRKHLGRHVVERVPRLPAWLGVKLGVGLGLGSGLGSGLGLGFGLGLRFGLELGLW